MYVPIIVSSDETYLWTGQVESPNNMLRNILTHNVLEYELLERETKDSLLEYQEEETSSQIYPLEQLSQ